jgi:uncharacterized protein (TIGR02246 family)
MALIEVEEMQNEQSRTERDRIKQVIENYIEAMRRSQADALASLFTDDGILMAVDAPTIRGAENINAFFAQGFGAVNIDAKIAFDEITVSGDYAFVLTHSEVQVTIKQANAVSNEKNRELFVLKNGDGAWKIARYMFNKVPA